MPSRFGRVVYVGVTLVGRTIASAVRKAGLSLIWDFEGAAYVGPRMMVRSASGAVRIGNAVHFGPEVSVECAKGGTLVVGADTSINRGTFIVVRQEMRIGRAVRIGEYCSIRDHDHEWRDPAIPIKDQGYICAPVIIEDDVWLGRGVVISKGVTVGRGAVVGANAVVTRDVAPFTVVAGVPARPIGHRGAPPP